MTVNSTGIDEVITNLEDCPESVFPDLESQLRHLATPLGKPKRGDWLSVHPEKGQDFLQYLAARPIRRDAELTTIYLCLVGEFTEPQATIVDRTREYLALFFDAPVRIRRSVPFDDIPIRAKRKHPKSGEKQLLTSYLLHDVLEPDLPDDALAYLALTTRDLWAGDGWNFVFGRANLRRRVGVWSIARKV